MVQETGERTAVLGVTSLCTNCRAESLDAVCTLMRARTCAGVHAHAHTLPAVNKEARAVHASANRHEGGEGKWRNPTSVGGLNMT